MDRCRDVTLTFDEWHDTLNSPGYTDDSYDSYRLEQSKRLWAIAASIPAEWSDASCWTSNDLWKLQNYIHTRWRVNLNRPGYFLIVEQLGWLTEEKLSLMAGGSDIDSWLLLSIKRLRVAFDELSPVDAEATLPAFLAHLETGISTGSPRVAARYVDYKCSRTSEPFNIADWVESETPAAPDGADGITAAGTGEARSVKSKSPKRKRKARRGLTWTQAAIAVFEDADAARLAAQRWKKRWKEQGNGRMAETLGGDGANYFTSNQMAEFVRYDQKVRLTHDELINRFDKASDLIPEGE